MSSLPYSKALFNRKLISIKKCLQSTDYKNIAKVLIPFIPLLKNIGAYLGDTYQLSSLPYFSLVPYLHYLELKNKFDSKVFWNEIKAPIKQGMILPPLKRTNLID
jgi:hypothetical protein